MESDALAGYNNIGPLPRLLFRRVRLAFPLDFDEIPEDVNGEDLPCQDFWDNYNEPIGMGGTPEDALADLISKMQ